jgi:rhomboid protease GluP
MSNALARAGETPVAYIVLLGYVTLALVTDPIDPSTEQLVRYGACVGLLVQDGEPWRLLSHAFLHGGIVHLLFNTLFMWQLGPAFERIVGSPRFALIYVVSALAGGLAGSFAQTPLGLLVGGSGALFGLLGAVVARNMRSGRHLLDFLNYAGPRHILGIIAANLVLGMLIPFVSNSAHVGGLIAGFVLMFCFLEPGRQRPDRASWLVRSGWIALLLAAFGYALAPVARFDYLLQRALKSRAPAVRAAFEDGLREVFGPMVTPQELVDEFEAGLPGYLTERVRRWQNEGR